MQYNSHSKKGVTYISNLCFLPRGLRLHQTMETIPLRPSLRRPMRRSLFQVRKANSLTSFNMLHNLKHRGHIMSDQLSACPFFHAIASSFTSWVCVVVFFFFLMSFRPVVSRAFLFFAFFSLPFSHSVCIQR